MSFLVLLQYNNRWDEAVLCKSKATLQLQARLGWISTLMKSDQTSSKWCINPYNMCMHSWISNHFLQIKIRTFLYYIVWLYVYYLLTDHVKAFTAFASPSIQIQPNSPTHKCSHLAPCISTSLQAPAESRKTRLSLLNFITTCLLYTYTIDHLYVERCHTAVSARP